MDPGSAPFDFGLSAEQEMRASRLHRNAIVIDLLSQHAGCNIFTAYSAPLQEELRAALDRVTNDSDRYFLALHWPYELSRSAHSHLIREWLAAAGLTCGTYGLEVHDGSDPHQRKWDEAAQCYDELPWVRRVTAASEIRNAKEDGVIALYAHCQPTSDVPRDLGAFDAAYGRGLRSFMLTYNRKNSIGSGCTEAHDAGLSAFGRQVIRRCNALGLIVDVSHCGPRTTLEACRHSIRPVNANHTAARAIYPHARGKSDEELQAIAETGGVIGVVAVPAFLTDQPAPSIHHMLDHIDHIASVAGAQHIALGTDWPLQAPIKVQAALLSPSNLQLGFRPQDGLDVTQRLGGFDDCRDLPNITRGLVSRGYRDEEILGIIGENALRVFAEVCG